MFCPACGVGVPPRSKFCFKCGTRLPVLPSAPPKASEPPRTWPSIGILFDIDGLRGDNQDAIFNYGVLVRRIFMTHFDPLAVGRAILWHGDTQATLDGEERFWCIAITVADPARLDQIRATFLKVEDRGLPPGSNRFRERPADVTFEGSQIVPLKREPLMQWFSVDEAGTIVLTEPVAEDVYLCRKFGRKLRLPEKLQARLERVQEGSAAPETVVSAGTDEEASIIEAIDLEIPGVPARLARYMDHFKKNGPQWGLQWTGGKLEDVIRWSREKIVARPDRKELEDVLWSLGMMFHSIEVYEGAAAGFSKLAECVGSDDPRWLDASAWQARCLMEAGKEEESRALAQKVLARRPDHEIAREVLDES